MLAAILPRSKNKQTEEGSKGVIKKYQDLQRKFNASEKELAELKEKLRKCENEKANISEKWIRLSSKNRHEDQIRK